MGPDHANTIVVVGQGSATITPDSAVLRVGLEFRADSASDALSTVTERAQDVLTAARERGIVDADLQTQGIALSQQMDSQGRRVAAYVASYSLSVRLRDIAVAPVVVDAVSRAAGDALRLGGFHLSVTDSEAARNDAAARAVADARGRAERIAAAAGIRLGRVLTVNDTGVAIQPRFMAMGSSAAVPMEAGSEEVVAHVTVTFEISD